MEEKQKKHLIFKDIQTQIEVQGLKKEDEGLYIEGLKSKNEKIRNKCINKLFLLNARLVLTFSREYNYREDIDDIEACGCAGLVDGIKKYDAAQGFKLSTYVCWYIKKRIYKYLYSQNSVYIPEYQITLHIQLNKIKEDLSKDGKEPSNKEILEVYNKNNKDKITEEDVEEVLNIKPQTVSMDMNINNGDDDELFLSDIIEDKNNINMDDVLFEEELSQKIEDILNDLTENERYVIKHRFGIGCNSQTLSTIGKELNGLSSERIRQIENSAIRKLRSPLKKKVLKSYLR